MGKIIGQAKGYILNSNLIPSFVEILIEKPKGTNIITYPTLKGCNLEEITQEYIHSKTFQKEHPPQTIIREKELGIRISKDEILIGTPKGLIQAIKRAKNKTKLSTAETMSWEYIEVELQDMIGYNDF